ncbi:MAG: heavy-metal-associated domain-containing protein [Bacteroidota bacterium]|nr:heavy-metal-associated domain-containing protein [Bacteroidota bacterium]
MKKNYEIKGMSCGGCVSNVKRALLQLPDVTEADVQLNPQSAVLTMSKPVNVEELQAQLKKAGHYTIKEALLN